MDVIDLCCEGLCMKPADADVTVRVTWKDEATRMQKVGLLCARHVNVLKDHAGKRMRQDKGLTVKIDARPLGTRPIHGSREDEVRS